MLSRMIKISLYVIATLSVCSIGIVLLISRPTYVFSVDDKTEEFIDLEKLKEHVLHLSTTFVPRNSSNLEDLNSASEYIKNKLSETTKNVTYQEYNVGDRRYRNVIASFGPETEEVTIVGAHYDAYSELPGADDNASGVAGLIELGRLLNTVELKQQVLLVAYTLEEPPYFASENMGSFVHASSLEGKKVRIMISLEMIGYFSDKPDSQDFPISLLSLVYPNQGNFIAIVDKFKTNDAVGLKSSINKYTDLPAYSINAPINIVGIDFSDHRNYWHFGYPAVMVTDTSFYRNKAYHTEHDTYDRLNYKLMAKVVFGVFKYVQEINGKT
ncbi:M28 family peptidase [Teredinibacter sp. KSP-S5-2]|uniref:M28 family peptidase n=1 Tax=Teredinibacter sp. KSP-S5-2 TaxID=3034506 RepID=UPI0029345ACE|nr:M28 family peptidase [Teredinibacter sp. KSP-S5-2]WNO09531.1 M28 family peptidase [Teredinibacter sp. KSP-S5-2]